MKKMFTSAGKHEILHTRVFWPAKLFYLSRKLIKWMDSAVKVGWEDENAFFKLFLDFIAKKLNTQLNCVLSFKNNFHLLNKVRMKIALGLKGTFFLLKVVW